MSGPGHVQMSGSRGAKRADVLLLDADPMAATGNTRRIAAMILGGQYLSRAVLDRRRRELEARYSSP